MLRKAILLCITYYALAVVISGCCNCPPGPGPSIHLTEVSLSSQSYTIEADSSVLALPDTGTDFSSKNYMLEATMGYVFVASNWRQHDPIMNEAYACKCAEGWVNVQEPVTSLRVYTVNNYDAAHPAGTEITDRFGSPRIVNGQHEGIGPLELVIPSHHYYGLTPYTGYRLFMAKRPDSGTTQQFRVVVTLQDSTTFTELTPQLQF